jgi:hypothetical protein
MDPDLSIQSFYATLAADESRNRLIVDDVATDRGDLSSSPAPDLHEQPPTLRGGRGSFDRQQLS